MSTDEYVEVDVGAGPVTVPVSTRLLSLGTGRGAVPVPADGPVDWSALDKLTDLSSLTWTGAERGVVAAVARHGVQYLEWHDAAGDIDLTPTRVTGLRLFAGDLTLLRLPATTTMLLLQDPPPAARVEAPGHGLDLRIFFERQEPAIPDGVRGAAKVWVRAGRTFSAGVLAALTEVESIEIELVDPPGTLADTGELGVHRRLARLVVDNAYDWDPATLPDLPALRELEVEGTRKTTAAALKARFKGTAVAVSVSGAKSESWLDAHIDNPFMDWVEDGKAFGTAACKAYAKAVKALADPERVEGALRGLVADLNAIQKKYGLIDTMNRDHAAEVFAGLAARAGVAEDTAEAWFDDRTF
ncbi:hypothetical protein [Asanoa iriomotensis]|uniref:Uncharacterized protein n=1 Tax=Asanoa iriomotensis TaxID=234613 RepID=A0ABQ4BTQ4_9ACTN|nr:hypothetical protein [Asanoa iriomotensis]GIF53919.1 hypothetical protein Air01nite_00140 [Asanoa iriomotensis]